MKTIEFKKFITLQRGFDLPQSERALGDVPVVASTKIIDRHNEYKVLAPAVITGRSGALGEVLYIQENCWPLNTTLWVKDFKENHPRYVYYFLKTLNLGRFNSGAGVPTLNRNDLGTLPIKIHSTLQAQREIAGILGAYDDLIENNNRRIKILEEMTQAIYKEWFIDFKFPGHKKAKFKSTKLGKIPLSWNISKVDDIVDRLTVKERYTEKDVLPEGNVMVIDQSTSEFLGFHNNEADLQATESSPLITFGDHTSKFQLHFQPISLGPNIIPFKAVDGMPEIALYFLIKDLIETKEYKRHWTELCSRTVPLPETSLLKKFSEVVQPLLISIENHKKRNFTLRRMRDLLLPKLISGEIDVEKMDIKI